MSAINRTIEGLEAQRDWYRLSNRTNADRVKELELLLRAMEKSRDYWNRRAQQLLRAARQSR